MPTTTPAAARAAYEQASTTVGPITLALTGDQPGRAIESAQQLATHLRTGVHVVSAVEPPTPAIVGLEGVPVWWPEPGEYVDRRRTRVVDRLREAGGDAAAWPVEVIIDAPAHAVAASADARHAAMIVMGVGRHDVGARLFGGEVTLRAIRRATVPLLAVTDAALRIPVSAAVAAIDFSPSSVKAARAALDLLADGGTLHLVHVWSRDPLGSAEGQAAEEAYARALTDRFAKVARALLERPRDVTLRPVALEGEVAEQLVTFAEAHGAQLVAAGRRGHGLLERLLVGRVTTALVRAAPCAVLVTPEPPVVERDALERALTGTSASRRSEEWPELLDAFSRRNLGRRTRLEVDDPAIGAQAEENGYVLRGATYDRHDGRVALMLGAPSGSAHLTRMIEDVTAIGVHGDASTRDIALAITHGAGQTLLTFVPDRP
ncbi:MAG: universal stress protein [Gemmatirosa sp.]